MEERVRRVQQDPRDFELDGPREEHVGHEHVGSGTPHEVFDGLLEEGNGSGESCHVVWGVALAEVFEAFG